MQNGQFATATPEPVVSHTLWANLHGAASLVLTGHLSRKLPNEFHAAFFDHVIETDAARQQAQAQVNQARADQQNARAQYTQAAAGERKARSLTRQQELRQAEDALTEAGSDERLARIEYDRYAYLVREGAAAQQSLDRAQATLDATAARRQSSEQALSLAREGARQEDKDAAAAQVNAARAQIDAAQHRVEEARAALRIANTRDTRLAVIRRQIDSLRAQGAQAREAVRQAQIALDKRTIRAPFTNHAIVLFEYALAEQREGVAMDQALLDVGRRRLRPILLTVLLSIFGVLPEGIHGGTLWPPLAWSLIFGLLMSLVLTLVIVPSFYKTISGRGQGLGVRHTAADD